MGKGIPVKGYMCEGPGPQDATPQIKAARTEIPKGEESDQRPTEVYQREEREECERARKGKRRILGKVLSEGEEWKGEIRRSSTQR